MKASGLLSSLLTCLLLFTTLSAAWPWPEFLEEKAHALMKRQEEKPTSTTANKSTQKSASAAQASKTNDSAPTAPASETGKASASASGTAAASASGSEASQSGASKTGGSKTTHKPSKSTAVDPRLPPGGVSMITPAALAGQQYYKVGDYVTFAWNYTSLSNTPSAIDVLASCSLNSATYTIAGNISVEETQSLIWDTGASQTNTQPFPVASYTLIIHDSSQDVDAVPAAGDLGSYNQYVFGMYTGQPYVPLNEFRCATCSGAMSIHEKQAFGVLLFTSLVTVLSFTWFANGFGLFA